MIEGRVEIFRQVESVRVYRVDRGIEVHIGRRVLSADGTANVGVMLKAEVDSKLELVRSSHIAKIVHHLVGVQRPGVGPIVNGIDGHRAIVQRELGDVGRLHEVESELVLTEHKFVGHVGGWSPTPIRREAARLAHRVYQARQAGKNWQATICRVAVGILTSPAPTKVNRILAVQDVIGLKRLIVLALFLAGGEHKARGIETVAQVEPIRQRLSGDESLQGLVQAEALGVVRNDIVGPNIDSRQDIAGCIHGSAGAARGTVPPAHHVAQNTLARLRGKNGSSCSPRIQGSQGLHVGKDEQLVLNDRAADAASINVLHEPALAQSQ